MIAKKCAAKDDDAVICLGAVIRGATPHFDYVANDVSKGIAQVSLQSEKTIIFGVLMEHAGTKAGNKGADATVNAIEMANLLREMER